MDGTILLVEDNQDHELLTLRALRKHNIVNDVSVAHDGADGEDDETEHSPVSEPVLLEDPEPRLGNEHRGKARETRSHRHQRRAGEHRARVGSHAMSPPSPGIQTEIA